MWSSLLVLIKIKAFFVPVSGIKSASHALIFCREACERDSDLIPRPCIPDRGVQKEGTGHQLSDLQWHLPP